jgi:hypothetical protein
VTVVVPLLVALVAELSRRAIAPPVMQVSKVRVMAVGLVTFTVMVPLRSVYVPCSSSVLLPEIEQSQPPLVALTQVALGAVCLNTD